MNRFTLVAAMLIAVGWSAASRADEVPARSFFVERQEPGADEVGGWFAKLAEPSGSPAEFVQFELPAFLPPQAPPEQPPPSQLVAAGGDERAEQIEALEALTETLNDRVTALEQECKALRLRVERQTPRVVPAPQPAVPKPGEKLPIRLPGVWRIGLNGERIPDDEESRAYQRGQSPQPAGRVLRPSCPGGVCPRR